MAKKAKKSKPKPHNVHKPKHKLHKAKPKLHKAKPKAKHVAPKHVKHAAHKPAPREVHREPAPIPTSMAPAAPVMVVPQGVPMPPVQVGRVHLQNISFEIASMRRMLERMLKQLDKLDEGIGERREME